MTRVLVHGGWSGWSLWGGCPVTCGGELESRIRTCTNPKPDRFGDNCYVDYHGYRICARQPCPTNITAGKILQIKCLNIRHSRLLLHRQHGLC